MSRFLSIVAIAIFTVACVDKDNDVGERCGSDYNCKDNLSCYQRKCRERGAEGATCTRKKHCAAGLACALSGICRTPKGAKAEQLAADAQREADLLRESGVEPTRIEEATKAAEEVVAASGAGAQVRVSATSTRERETFAACRADERLVGGGCRTRRQLKGSFPSKHGATDTVGARWNCVAEKSGSASLEAFALCQQIPKPAGD